MDTFTAERYSPHWMNWVLYMLSMSWFVCGWQGGRDLLAGHMYRCKALRKPHFLHGRKCLVMPTLCYVLCVAASLPCVSLWLTQSIQCREYRCAVNVSTCDNLPPPPKQYLCHHACGAHVPAVCTTGCCHPYVLPLLLLLYCDYAGPLW